MSGSRKVLVVAIIAVAGAGAVWLGLARRHAHFDAEAVWRSLADRHAHSGAAALAPAASGTATPPVRAPQPPSRIAGANARAPSSAPFATDFAETFREARNYRSFIVSALPAAQHGDRDAEYFLSAALAYCDETNRFFFRRGDKTLSVDAAILERSRFGGIDMTDAIRRAYDRCREVNATQDASWRTAEQWLAKAAQAGQPMAQMRTAEEIFLRLAKADALAAADNGSGDESAELSEARALVRAAVQSRDPEAIFEMGDAVAIVKPEEQGSEYFREAVTWRYVACLRGLDCSPTAEWYLQFCLHDPNCVPGESGIDYLRRAAQLQGMVDLQERANALNDQIDAGAWNDLGLGG